MIFAFPDRVLVALKESLLCVLFPVIRKNDLSFKHHTAPVRTDTMRHTALHHGHSDVQGG